MALDSMPASSSLARTQLCMNDSVNRAEQRVMIGAESVVISCNRSGFVVPVSNEITRGSTADSVKKSRNP